MRSENRGKMDIASDIEIPIGVERYALLSPGITRCHFIGPLLAVLGSAVSSVAAPVIAGATALGSAAVSTAGAIGSTALAGAGALGQAIPQVIGGISSLAKAAGPAAELFGAGYGVYQSIEQQKIQKKALEIQAGQYATAARMSQEALAMRGVAPPIQTLPTRGEAYPSQAEQKREFYMGPPEPTGAIDLWSYAPLVLIALLLLKIVK